jgi:intracellular sulfur oxidation DsrE/DsrF family protein
VFWQAHAGEEMADYAVDVLQSRGAQFLLCNNVLRRVTRTLAGRTGVTYAAMRAELIAGLLPKVIVVPAMAVALGRAQEHGCAYVYAG